MSDFVDLRDFNDVSDFDTAGEFSDYNGAVDWTRLEEYTPYVGHTISSNTINPRKYNFFFKDVNNGLGHSYDIEAIKNSVITILTTPQGAVPGMPDFGSRLHSMLFDVIDHILESTIDLEVKRALGKYEDRITVIQTAVARDPRNPYAVILNIFYKFNYKELSGKIYNIIVSYNTADL